MVTFYFCWLLQFPVAAAEGRPFSVTFEDEAGKPRTLRFELDADAVRVDVDRPLGYPGRAAGQVQVEAVRAYARTVKGPKVSATSRGSAVSIRVTGRDRGRMREALRGAKAVAAAALARFHAEHRWVLEGKVLRPDHPQLVVDYADDVAPVARSLAVGIDLGTEAGRRTYAERAVRFVQAIPYERRKGGGDKGYRPPLAVLARNRGDCDSKSVLYLSLLRAQLPEVDSAIVYIPRHAFVALDLAPEARDLTVRVDGERWVVVEPVGPARAPLGEGSRRTRRHARVGLVEVEPVAGGPRATGP